MIPFPIADAGRSAIVILAVWRLFDLNRHSALARLSTITCDECTQPIRWWNRRVWIVEHERCAHLQCWKGQLFLKSYVQLMAEELRHSPQSLAHTRDGDCTDTELSELRAAARALRQRVERLEAQLERAEVVAAAARTGATPKTVKLSAPSRAMPAKKG